MKLKYDVQSGLCECHNIAPSRTISAVLSFCKRWKKGRLYWLFLLLIQARWVPVLKFRAKSYLQIYPKEKILYVLPRLKVFTCRISKQEFRSNHFQ